jgi:hypothetical protein
MNQCCEEWEKGVKEINGAFAMSTIHHGAPYASAPFRFCPWCGKPIVQEPVSEIPTTEPEPIEMAVWTSGEAKVR